MAIPAVGYGSSATSAWANAVVAAVNAQTAGVYTTSTARDLAVTTPTEGMVAYLTTPDEWTIYSAGAWRLIPFTTSWSAPTFTNSWVNFGGVYQVAQYRKVGDMVQLRGTIKTGTSGTSAFTLPTGYRPPAAAQWNVPGGGSYAVLEISTAGLVTPIGAAVSTACSITGQFSVTS